MIWIVRDSDEQGQPKPYVTVWWKKPQRERILGEWHWFNGVGDQALDGWVGSLLMEDAWRILGTTPDDHIQMVVMDRCPRAVYEAINRANGFRVPKP